MNADGKKSRWPYLAALCAAALICAGAAVLCGKRTGAVQAAAPDDMGRAIAYVPLDDRTDNTDYVEYEAAACGYKLIMPGRSLYSTKLDGQGLNPDGTQHGDREALFQWVRKMDSGGCNIFLLSLDQLMSGGLVSSRSLKGESGLSFDGGGVMTEDEAFDEFILALGRDPNNRVYLFDSVMRLASTVGYEGMGLDEYSALREYGGVPRRELSGAELTLANIFGGYPLAADGAAPAQDFIAHRSALTQGMIDGYLAARERKLRMLDHVMDAIRGKSQFKLLVGVDDSSGGDNIHSNELKYIAAHIGGGTLLPGMDSMARLQLARIALDGCGKRVGASVEYFGGEEDKPSSNYDNGSLRDSVEAHLRLFGADMAGAADPKIYILVLTAPRDAGKSGEYCEALSERLRENQSRGRPTVLIDASGGKYGGALTDTLLAKVDFAGLLGFSGRYDQASVTGAALAMGFSRMAYLIDGGNSAGDAAHVRQMANTMVLSMVYSARTHFEINAFITSMGYDYTNIKAPAADMGKLTAELSRLVTADSAAVLQNLAGGRVITNLRGGRRGVESAELDGAVFPWNRSFEISLNIKVSVRQWAL